MAYQSEYTGTDIDKGISLALAMYPVGSIYLSVNNVNPGTIFGGTWEQIQDRFLLAAGSTYAGGTTGGATSHTHTSAAHTHTSAAHTHTTAGHTLTVNEMPSHKHGVSSYVSGWEGWSKGDIGAYFLHYGAFENPDASTKNVYRGSSGNYQVTNTGGGASHSHGNTGSTTPGNTGSTTPGNTGSSSSLPPYLAIYVWKRTA